MVEVLPESMQTSVGRLHANSLTASYARDLNKVLLEFSPNAKPLQFEEWESLASGNYLTVVSTWRRGIVGMATLVTFRIPTGIIGLVEDVAVLSTWRGQGLGEALVLDLIREAKARQIKHIDLTSRRKRVEANRLYQKLGFEYRETNNYRLTL